MKTQIQMARELAPQVGSENPRALAVFLSQIFNGRRALPERYEVPLMDILGINSRYELLTLYPAMRFKVVLPRPDVRRQVDIEIHPVTPSSTVNEGRLPEIVALLQELSACGVKLEIRIRGTS